MADDILIPDPMRAADTLSAPKFTLPDGSWDTHVHVFGPETAYPRVPKPHYTLPEGTLAQLQAMTRQLGIQRFVIVQPSFYGTDNRCMLDALKAAGPTARGVAMVDESVTDEALQTMHELGVRGLRLDLFLRSNWALEDIKGYITRSIQRVHPLGWHVQFYTPGWLVRDLLPFFAQLETDFVIDHMGYMLESDGLTTQDFDRLVSVVAQGSGWLKLSGPYRLAKDGNFDRLKPLAEALVAAAPSRVIWGSDWPHIPQGQMDTGGLLNLLGDWVPDERVRNAILADNPARLFRS